MKQISLHHLWTVIFKTSSCYQNNPGMTKIVLSAFTYKHQIDETDVMPFSLHSLFRLVAERQHCPDGSFYCGGVPSLQILTESVPQPQKSSNEFVKTERFSDK